MAESRSVRPALTVAGSGWGPAARWALAVVATVGMLGELLALLVYAAGSGDRPSLVDFLRVGGFLMFAFHHVPIVLEGSAGGIPGSGIGGGSDVLIAVAPLGGTALALWLLFVGGRAVAGSAEGSARARVVHGVKVALPYSVAMGALSWAVAIPAGDLARGSPSIHPSHAAAFLWPLVLGVLAGAAGGHGAGREKAAVDGPPRETSDAHPREAAPQDVGVRAARSLRLGRGAAAGGGWMLVLGLGLAFAGLVLLAPANPDATRLYFRPFDRGVVQGLAVVVFTSLVVPNMALAVLFPAMGGCLTAAGAVGDRAFSVCLLSYTDFPSSAAILGLLSGGRPGGGSATGDLPVPPGPYLLFVVVPLLAVLIGGSVASRRSGAANGRQGLVAGALAGFLFAALAVLAIVLVSARLVVDPSVGSPRVVLEAGPDLVRGGLVALAWGVLGGAAGGFVRAGGRRRAPRTAGPPSPRPG